MPEKSFNKHSRRDFALGTMTKILRASKITITKGSSGANHKMMPYLGGVLMLTRIVYVALDEETFPKPWDKPTGIEVGTKSISGSRPTKKDRSKTSKSNIHKNPSTQSETHKAQSNKSPPAQDEEQDKDISDLQEAIKLSKSEEARTSKKDASSLDDPWDTKNSEERALREAIRRSLAKTNGKPATLPFIL